MTRKEAINELKNMAKFNYTLAPIEVFEMAIQALEQEPKGHWVEENINGGRKVFCSECGCPPPFEYVSTGDVYSASGYGEINKTKFCPNCGAKMESEVQNDSRRENI